MSIEFKGPQDVILDLPQERITAITGGRGPRRGNLERLLRYWRPIMKKPGGFRRCRVILANHPELYPLERICAWLHHETTGLWPNEGCHHPGMKNCRGKLKKRNWSDADWGKRMARRFKKGKKKSMYEDFAFSEFYDIKADYSFDTTDKGYNQVVTHADFKHAMDVLNDFMHMEPEFTAYLRDNANWEIVGEAMDGTIFSDEFTDEYCTGCN